ncbi:MAG: restriction endonuclease subunit S [Clostridia bacterium]|nr:restriction endonuclease subunit S [Clostridia bacterium]
MRLGDFSNIRTGLVLSRKKAKSESEAIKEYTSLTLKSFEDDGTLNLRDLDVFVSKEVLNARYITRRGDVIIRLSHPNTAIYITEDAEGYVIPSQFSVVSINNKDLLPSFFSIYFNSSHVKRLISKHQMGATIPVINNAFLADLQIVNLPIDKQRMIADIHSLHLREKELLKDLLDEKEKLFKAVISQLVK